VTVVLEGDTFDDSSNAARIYCTEKNKTYIPAFDDPKIIEGQATVGLEILEQAKEPIDYLFVAVGGGGLASGLCAVFNTLSPRTKNNRRRARRCPFHENFHKKWGKYRIGAN